MSEPTQEIQVVKSEPHLNELALIKAAREKAMLRYQALRAQWIESYEITG